MMRRTSLALTVGVLATCLLAQPVAAAHKGAALDCGDAGQFTLRAVENGAGFQAPVLGGVILFEEGGLLTPLVAYRDGVLQWGGPARGLATNVVEEVTCTFTIASGFWEITGVLTGYGSPVP